MAESAMARVLKAGEHSIFGVVLLEPLRSVISARIRKSRRTAEAVLLELVHKGLECERLHKDQ